MSFDSVSQTSDYSSSSEKSASRSAMMSVHQVRTNSPSNCSQKIPSKAYHMPLSERMILDPQPRATRNHHHPINGKRHEIHSKSSLNTTDRHSHAIESQLKSLVCENAMLKKECKSLQEKCQKIDMCEKQFTGLQHQYEEFVKSSSTRQALERQLRIQLEDDLQEAQRLSAQFTLEKPKVSVASQTVHSRSSLVDGDSREQQLMREVSALKLMLREKEELIMTLLEERNSKPAVFCTEDFDEDYIASNVVSL